ncbi:MULTISPECIES: hypothetical protein [Sphingobium]|uniref:hypothetical protein n=1 Tax=Sphingobium TaxID=165695 RepID=UPI0015EB6ACD|nr:MULTISPECIES: hypothetical protein [Sphingobium]MCW2361376.1 hypothetical protein [Sphingobium sp. B10D3B]MCW2401945.1 hypothetical protein [Sphingobium sp. B10D7B]MCW2408924.1 hypothetical protein [Sphingobium xanthum]
MAVYKQFSGAELSKNVGQDIERKVRRSLGESGHLVFGPYAALPPAEYVAAFYVRRWGEITGGSADFDITDHIVGQLAAMRVADRDILPNIPGQVSMRFTLNQPVDRLEARIHVGENVFIDVHRLVIFSTEFQRWAA